MSYRKKGYKERLHKQTLDWLNGKPTHNSIDGECCPDFSCCNPQLLAPTEVRQVYYNAEQKGDDNTTDRLLGEFLAKSLEATFPDKKIHITPLDIERENS